MLKVTLRCIPDPQVSNHSLPMLKVPPSRPSVLANLLLTVPLTQEGITHLRALALYFFLEHSTCFSSVKLMRHLLVRIWFLNLQKKKSIFPCCGWVLRLLVLIWIPRLHGNLHLRMEAAGSPCWLWYCLEPMPEHRVRGFWVPKQGTQEEVIPPCQGSRRTRPESCRRKSIQSRKSRERVVPSPPHTGSRVAKMEYRF